MGPFIYMTHKADKAVADAKKRREIAERDTLVIDYPYPAREIQDFKPLSFPDRTIMPHVDAQFTEADFQDFSKNPVFAQLAEPIASLQLLPSAYVEISAPVQPIAEPLRKRKDNKFCIGKAEGNDLLFALGHMFLVRKTGGGKSNIVAIIIGQALEQGLDVWFSAVSYKPVDEDFLNIGPLIDRCIRIAIEPSGVEQLQLLRDAVKMINERTIEAQKNETAYFKSVLIVAEEVKALQSKLNLLQKTKVPGFETSVDEAGALMEIILATGRAYNVNLLLVAQDGQSQTVKMSQGTLNNCEIRIAHPSLDRASLANLLPKGFDRKHTPLPVPTSPYQWFVVFENEMGVEQLVMVDVPKITNDSVARYVYGRAPIVREKPVQQAVDPAASAPAHMRQVGDPVLVVGPNITQVGGRQESEPSLGFKVNEKHFKVLAFLQANPNATQTEVANAVWGRSDGSYSTRAREYVAMMKPFVTVTVTPILEKQQESNPDCNAENDD